MPRDVEDAQEHPPARCLGHERAVGVPDDVGERMGSLPNHGGYRRR